MNYKIKYRTNVIAKRSEAISFQGGSEIAFPQKKRDKLCLAMTNTANTKKPLFFSQINPDLYFVGFDLTSTHAKGSNTPNSTNPGWFVCFEERAGEIVFGADEERVGSMQFNTWDDLAWNDLNNSKFINVAQQNIIPNQLVEQNIVWGSNSADMAYAMFQKPSRVFIHSNDMIN